MIDVGGVIHMYNPNEKLGFLTTLHVRVVEDNDML